jgi:hypothetical protein
MNFRRVHTLRWKVVLLEGVSCRWQLSSLLGMTSTGYVGRL